MKENIEKPQKKNGVVSFLKEEEVKEEGKNACNDLSLSLSLSLSPRQGEIDKETAVPRARLFTVESQKLGRTRQIENILPRWYFVSRSFSQNEGQDYFQGLVMID